MKDDKAIFKALKSQESIPLSAGFNSRMMSKIYLVVEKKKKRAYVLSLCLLSTVSIGLIAMTVYLLRNHLTFNFTIQFPAFNTLTETVSKYGFSIYIAFLIFILIGLDTFLRSVFKKRKEDKFKHYNL